MEEAKVPGSWSSQMQEEEGNTTVPPVAAQDPKYLPPITPHDLLVEQVEIKIDRISRRGLPDFTTIGAEYIEEAFHQNFYLKEEVEEWQCLELGPLFKSGMWSDQKCEAICDQWKSWREIGEFLRSRLGERYLQYVNECNLGQSLQSEVRKLFSQKVSAKSSNDFAILMEIVQYADLEFKLKKDLTIVNVGDPSNWIEVVMSHMAKGSCVKVKSVIADNIRMKTKDFFKMPSTYVWENRHLDAFLASLKRIGTLEQRKYQPFIGVDLIYQKYRDNSDGVKVKEFNGQRVLYSTICLAIKTLCKGGTIIFNASHLSLDGFYICNMYLLCSLFSEVSLKKPLSGLDSSTEIAIIAKGFLGKQTSLCSEILKGNDVLIMMNYKRGKYPLPLDRIPPGFVTKAINAGEQRYQWFLKHNQRNLLLFRTWEDQETRVMQRRCQVKTFYKWMRAFQLEDVVFGKPEANEELRRQLESDGPSSEDNGD